jgi:anti-anti-sigma factor
MLLRVDVHDRPGHALIVAMGEIDIGTADQVADAVSAALSAGQKRVLLDFAQVTFIDSSGLAALVKAHREADAGGATLALVQPTPQTLKLIQVLGLDQLLFVYDTREQALGES